MVSWGNSNIRQHRIMATNVDLHVLQSSEEGEPPDGVFHESLCERKGV